jgi:hypothetical protein
MNNSGRNRNKRNYQSENAIWARKSVEGTKKHEFHEM